jgi:Tfp pilus assembly protein PilW
MLVTFRTIPSRGRPRGIRSEAGYTLIELLVASAAAITLLGATLSLLESSQQVQARDTEWALTLEEGRAGLARMTRDIRQASKVETQAAGAIDFFASVGGVSWQIKYECGVAQTGTKYDECVRFAAEGSKSLPSTGTPVIRDVVNGTTVFSYSPSSSPNVVTLKVELAAQGTLHQAGSSGYTHNTVLEDAAFMRNLDPSG